ncbi:hypothetical protein AX17_004703 [Amanita inopinata Kibby_2008]|nr:hypothetical protein AX17_004703 [Amanita inopinata Kibby_2008]
MALRRVSIALVLYAFASHLTLLNAVPVHGFFMRDDNNPNTDFKKQNGLDAQKLNVQYASLSPSDPCKDGSLACINHSFAECAGGKWSLTPCASGLQCFVMPLVNSPGTSIGCDTTQDATARIAASGVGGGLTGTFGNNSTNGTNTDSGASQQHSDNDGNDGDCADDDTNEGTAQGGGDGDEDCDDDGQTGTNASQGDDCEDDNDAGGVEPAGGDGDCDDENGGGGGETVHASNAAVSQAASTSASYGYRREIGAPVTTDATTFVSSRTAEPSVITSVITVNAPTSTSTEASSSTFTSASGYSTPTVGPSGSTTVLPTSTGSNGIVTVTVASTVTVTVCGCGSTSTGFPSASTTVYPFPSSSASISDFPASSSTPITPISRTPNVSTSVSSGGTIIFTSSASSPSISISSASVTSSVVPPTASTDGGNQGGISFSTQVDIAAATPTITPSR